MDAGSVVGIGFGLIYLWMRVRWLDSDLLDNKMLILSLIPVSSPASTSVSDAPRANEVIVRRLATPK